MVMALELRLHSPAGAEPNVYKWPLTSGRGAVSFAVCQCLLQTCCTLAAAFSFRLPVYKVFCFNATCQLLQY